MFRAVEWKTVTRGEEEFRHDQRQNNAKGVTTDDYDGGKGLELSPFQKVEVIFNLSPYIDHNSPATKNGWGDAAFPAKNRLLSRSGFLSDEFVTEFRSE
jgi:hypothetical protein